MTLVEVVVAMIVLSLAVVAIMTGMTLLASSSLMARQRADVGAALRSAAEQVKSFSYSSCTLATSPQSQYASDLGAAMPPTSWPEVNGTSDVGAVTVVAVDDATAASPTPLPAGCTQDPGLQAVRITVSSSDGKVSESLWVVKRAPS